MNNETKFNFDPENNIVTNNETGSKFHLQNVRDGYKLIPIDNSSLEDRPVVAVNGIFY